MDQATVDQKMKHAARLQVVAAEASQAARDAYDDACDAKKKLESNPIESGESETSVRLLKNE